MDKLKMMMSKPGWNYEIKDPIKCPPIKFNLKRKDPGNRKEPVVYRRRNTCPNFENPAYSGPSPGSLRTYYCFVGDDRSIEHDHRIIFSGDKFLILPYGSKENVKILDVDDPTHAPFLESIGKLELPKEFRKVEGAHRIMVIGLFPGQDLLKDIGLGPSVSKDVSEDEGESSDDNINFDSGDDMDEGF